MDEKAKNTVLFKAPLSEGITEMRVYAPAVAKAAKPGQFIIYRVGEEGERIPLTIADSDPAEGSVTVVFQTVGYSTMKLGMLETGEVITDFVGPLGNPSALESGKRVAVIGGGLGCAIAYPQAKALTAMGSQADLIAGFRSKSFVFWEEKMKKASPTLTVCTDDGSYGFSGFVTAALEEKIKSGVKYDEVIAIGPLPMMKGVCAVTKPYGIKTTVSMNTIMIDGTGMCGCCRLKVDGKFMFACVDGPDFDGHLVDFDEVIKRNRLYRPEEAAAREKGCNLLKQPQ